MCTIYISRVWQVYNSGAFLESIHFERGSGTKSINFCLCGKPYVVNFRNSVSRIFYNGSEFRIQFRVLSRIRFRVAYP